MTDATDINSIATDLGALRFPDPTSISENIEDFQESLDNLGEIQSEGINSIFVNSTVGDDTNNGRPSRPVATLERAF